jgi:hypothetical protein
MWLQDELSLSFSPYLSLWSERLEEMWLDGITSLDDLDEPLVYMTYTIDDLDDSLL